MAVRGVKVPGALLLDRRISDSAKLLWITRVGGDSPGATAGLDRHTVKKALAQLAAAGWLPAEAPAGPPQTGTLPHALLANPDLGTAAKLLFGLLQLTPGFSGRAGRYTYPGLHALTGASPNTLKSAASQLQRTGWLTTTRQNKQSPVQFTLCNPAQERGQLAKDRARRSLKKAKFKGEAILRAYLSLLIESDRFEDDATPGFLVNPFTGEEMQLDRYYYEARVALEFNGPQHDGPTEQFPDEDAFRRQQARDWIKAGICETRGIKLIVVQAADLQLPLLRQKLEPHLPIRDLTGYEPLINYLEAVSRSYRNKASSVSAPA